MRLQDVTGPECLRNLSVKELNTLCDEIREEIVSVVSENGGHLASNLGVVELTVALHRVFDFSKDKLVFDVGHQCYPHKLLTGRYKDFDTLRKRNGISGFPKAGESSYDCFETGHSSTAISAALGLARARDLKGEKQNVLALVGDGALTGGMCYEALNDAGQSKTRLIVILNDNGMSISPNVGALSTYLTGLRASRGWNVAKSALKKTLDRIPVLGFPIYKASHHILNAIKSLFVSEKFFTSLGFKYLGPVDGHDIKKLESVLKKAKYLDEPVVIHCSTRKGHGYQQAENDPESFHGTAPFFVETGDLRKNTDSTVGRHAANELFALAGQDKKIVAVSAAMIPGTGLAEFREKLPERVFDVGIAEEHAVTMCAGMARSGMKPFFFVYSTFLQRGYDQLLHDVCLQGLPVCVMIDRAGLVGEDGQTHQGVYDLHYLLGMPGLRVFAPMSVAEMREQIRYAVSCKGPCAIRYPRSLPETGGEGFVPGKWRCLRQGNHAAVLAVGSMVSVCVEAVEKVAPFHVAVYNASSVSLMDEELLRSLLASGVPVFTAEEGIHPGGFGSMIASWRNDGKGFSRLHSFGVSLTPVPHATRQQQLASQGLIPGDIASGILHFLQEEKK